MLAKGIGFISNNKLGLSRRCQWLLLFWLCNIPLYLAFSVRYLFASGISLDFSGWLYVLVLYIGQFGMFAFIFCFILPLLGVIFSRGSPGRWIAALFAVIGLFLLAIDGTIYRIYHYHVNAFVFLTLFSRAAGFIFNFAWAEWAVAILILAGGALIQLFIGRGLWNYCASKRPPRFWPAVLGVLVALSLFVSHLWHAYADAYNQVEIVQAAETVPVYFGLTARRWMLAHNLVTEKQLNTNPAVALHQQSHIRKMRYPQHPLQFGSKKQHYNILIIGIDDVRFDEMTPKVAPHIMNFATKGWRFQQHYSGGNCTQPGIFTLFYGIPANYWGSTIHSATPPLLISSLQKYGYKTAAYVSAPLVQPAFYKNVFVTVPKLRMYNPGKTSWQNDVFITQEMVKFINKNAAAKNHFLGFMFYDAVHGYEVPPNFPLLLKPSQGSFNRLTLNNDTDPTPYKNAHKNALHYVDTLVEKVLRTVEHNDLLKNTIVIITTDHGEEFNDNHHNYWGHSSNFSVAQTHIPFIMYWPGRGAREINYRTSHFDVAPTLLQGVLGVKNPISDYAIGHSLLQSGGRENLLLGSYSFMGLVTPHRILKFYPGGAYSLTDLHLNPQRGVDPKAMHQAMLWMAQFY